jgi:hypothetical protein
MKAKRYTLIVVPPIIILPVIYQDYLYDYIPLFYLFGVYIILINFPNISTYLHTRPIYVNDLIEMDEWDEIYVSKAKYNFRSTYVVVMNVFLALLVSILTEYALVKEIHDKPYVEIFGLFGGILSIYIKIQNVFGKLLLSTFQHFHTKRKRSMSMELSENDS